MRYAKEIQKYALVRLYKQFTIAHNLAPSTRLLVLKYFKDTDKLLLRKPNGVVIAVQRQCVADSLTLAPNSKYYKAALDEIPDAIKKELQVDVDFAALYESLHTPKKQLGTQVTAPLKAPTPSVTDTLDTNTILLQILHELQVLNKKLGNV